MLEKGGFELEAPYRPTGDQPKAIRELVERIRSGERYSVLLGATGTGKSVPGDTLVLLLIDGALKMVPIGDFVDELIPGGKNQSAVVNISGVSCLAFDPATQDVSFSPVSSFSRHPSPDHLIRIRTNTGLSVDVTPDHSVWVLRNEGLVLERGDGIAPGDYIPGNRGIPALVLENQGFLDITEILKDANLRVEFRGRSWSMREFHALRQKEGLGLEDLRNARVVGLMGKSLPGVIPAGPSMSRLLGYLHSVHFLQNRYLNFPTKRPWVAEKIGSLLSEMGLPTGKQRPRGLYQVSSRALWELAARLVGVRSERRPPCPIICPAAHAPAFLAAVIESSGRINSRAFWLSPKHHGALVCLECALSLLGIGYRVLPPVGKRGYFKLIVNRRQDVLALAGLSGLEGEITRELRALAERLPDGGEPEPIPGKAICSERRRLGLTQAHVAERAGLSIAQISHIEKGRTRYLRGGIAKLREFLPAGLRNLDNLRWHRVISTEKVKPRGQFVYDLSVPGKETFLAGYPGLFVHNTFTIANVIKELGLPTLVISHNKTLAAQLYGEFRGFFPRNAVEYFISYYDYYMPEAYIPETDTYVPKEADINERIERLRLRTAASLLSRRDVIVVASVSCIYSLGDPEEMREEFIMLKKGDEYDIQELSRKLVHLQYERTTGSLSRGKFRLKGDTLDIIPAYEEDLWRLEFFGTRLERITVRDPLSMRIKNEPEMVSVYPAAHFLVARPRLEEALKSIEEELRERLEELEREAKLLEAQRLKQRTLFDLEMLREIGYCHGIENYSRHLSGRAPGERPKCLIDYFPRPFLTVIDESHVTVPQIEGMYEGDRSRKEILVEHGFRLPSCLDNRPLKFQEFEELVGPVIFMSATPGPYELEKTCGVITEQIIRPTGLVDPEMEIRPTEGQIDDILNEIAKATDAGQRVLITTLTKRSAEELSAFLRDMGIKADYIHSELDAMERVRVLRDLRLGKINVLVGVNLLREGLDLPEVSLVIITDAERTGFLRSYTSLIQTAGRAARNLAGKVILYADEITPAMEKAIAETARRRRLQLRYNEEHGIIPRSIVKSPEEIMATTGVLEEAEIPEPDTQEAEHIAQEVIRSHTRPDALAELERLMNEAAERLDFEAAAVFRDAMRELLNKPASKKPIRERNEDVES
ncbi:MAG: excinuclease ABC subunit UvrB [candidate division WOR-3 bacterium]